MSQREGDPASSGRFGLLVTGIADLAALVAVLMMPVAALGRIAGWIDWRTMLFVFSLDLDVTAAAIVFSLIAFVVNRRLPWRSFRLGGAALAFLVGVAVMVPQGATALRALLGRTLTIDTAPAPIPAA